MPGPNSPYTQLDSQQVIRQVYDETTDRLRVETNATVVAGAMEVLITSDDDNILVVGTEDGTKTGTQHVLRVAPNGDAIVDQGAPNTVANSWPVKVTDGTDTLVVNPDGSINFNQTTTVIANNATLSNITSSTSSQLIFSSSVNRKGFIFYNDSTSNCYIAFASTASSSAFTILLNSGMTYQNEAIIYTGSISVVWATANGFLRVTELT